MYGRKLPRRHRRNPRCTSHPAGASYPRAAEERQQQSITALSYQVPAVAGCDRAAADRRAKARKPIREPANALEDNVVLYKPQGRPHFRLTLSPQGGVTEPTSGFPATPGIACASTSVSRFRVSFMRQLSRSRITTLPMPARSCWTKADSVTLFDQIPWGEANRRGVSLGARSRDALFFLVLLSPPFRRLRQRFSDSRGAHRVRVCCNHHAAADRGVDRRIRPASTQGYWPPELRGGSGANWQAIWPLLAGHPRFASRAA